jgi:hypothetical protein
LPTGFERENLRNLSFTAMMIGVPMSTHMRCWYAYAQFANLTVRNSLRRCIRA